MRSFMTGLVLVMLTFGVARAAGSGSGTVANITPIVLNGTEFFVVTLSTMSGQPACADGSRFALSASDPKYKSVLAILLGAYFSGSSVFARGLGTCNLYASSEDLGYVCLNNGVPC